MTPEIASAVEAIRQRADGFQPKVALILGTGIGGLADQVDAVATISYQDIPGFPRPSVKGHAGKLVLGHLEGVPVAVFRGRVHLYEGGGFEPLKILVRTIRFLEVDFLFLTNAAGSLQPEVGPGSLVALTDHINLQGINPLVGPNDEDYGPRFVDLENCWDPQLRAQLVSSAKKIDVDLHEGVFAAWMGPVFETPAEIRMLRIVGAHTVGMSMVPENIVARHCGLKCVGVSAITNFAVGVSKEPVNHDTNLENAKLAAAKLIPLTRQFLKDLAAQPVG